MNQNKKTGDKGEQIVIDYYRKKGKKAEKVSNHSGYDVKAGKRLIEVKTRTRMNPPYFALSSNEFNTALKNKNYWVYWVDPVKKKIVDMIDRDEVLASVQLHTQYRLTLSKLKKTRNKK